MFAIKKTSGDDASEHGSVSLFLSVTAVGVFMMIGLAYDGSGKMRTALETSHVAQEAARAGTQELDARVILGEELTMDPARATDAINRFVRDTHSGARVSNIRFMDGNRRVRVELTNDYDPVFLNSIGIGRMRVSGSAEAAPVRN